MCVGGGGGRACVCVNNDGWDNELVSQIMDGVTSGCQ